jgi:hypothetical protein
VEADTALQVEIDEVDSAFQSLSCSLSGLRDLAGRVMAPASWRWTAGPWGQSVAEPLTLSVGQRLISTRTAPRPDGGFYFGAMVRSTSPRETRFYVYETDDGLRWRELGGVALTIQQLTQEQETAWSWNLLLSSADVLLLGVAGIRAGETASRLHTLEWDAGAWAEAVPPIDADRATVGLDADGVLHALVDLDDAYGLHALEAGVWVSQVLGSAVVPSSKQPFHSLTGMDGVFRLFLPMAPEGDREFSPFELWERAPSLLWERRIFLTPLLIEITPIAPRPPVMLAANTAGDFAIGGGDNRGVPVGGPLRTLGLSYDQSVGNFGGRAYFPENDDEVADPSGWALSLRDGAEPIPYAIYRARELDATGPGELEGLLSTIGPLPPSGHPVAPSPPMPEGAEDVLHLRVVELGAGGGMHALVAVRIGDDDIVFTYRRNAAVTVAP